MKKVMQWFIPCRYRLTGQPTTANTGIESGVEVVVTY